MNMKWHKTKFAVYTFVLVIIIFVIVTAIYFKIDYENEPVKEENQLIAPYLYDIYTPKKPDIQNSLFYGNEKASITIISYLDFDSEASKIFIKEIFPIIKKDYIDPGNLKYYNKNYITLEDIEEKNNNYLYSMAMLCVEKLAKTNYFNFYFDLFRYDVDNIPELIKKYDISKKVYDECEGNENNLKELQRNALENENLGIIGVNQRFYIGIAGKDNTVLVGIPKYSKFQDSIRQYEVKIGN